MLLFTKFSRTNCFDMSLAFSYARARQPPILTCPPRVGGDAYIYLAYILHLLYTLQAAVSLEKRPALHNSSLMVVINLCPFVICWFLCSSKTSSRTAAVLFWYIFAVAWTTHHLRDGLRRGLWIAPFGHTPPLPKLLYLASVTAIPLTLRTIMFVYVTSADQKPQLLDV